MQTALNILDNLIDVIEDHDQSQQLYNEENPVPFTAILVAFYRYIDVKSPELSKPLLNDTFAEELCVTNVDKIKFAEPEMQKLFERGDTNIVFRSYYIEQYPLKEFVSRQNKLNNLHQIVLLGAGLDSRAYRLDFLHSKNTIIYEIDFDVIIKYKQSILSKYKPKCGVLKRLSIDLSSKDWHKILIQNGFDVNIPTIFILEGLYYYLTEKDNITLFTEINKLCQESKDNNDYEIFVDSVNAMMNICANPSANTPILKAIKFQFVIHFEELQQYFTNFKWSNVKVTDSFYACQHAGLDNDIYVTPYLFWFVHANKGSL